MDLNDQKQDLEISIDKDNLFREESFTDLKAGVIKRLTPVKADGTPDAGRSAIYMGQAQMMAPTGPIPIQFELQVSTMEEAIDQFPAGVKETVEKIIEEAKQLRREAASRIVVPGQDTASKILT
ncbi:cytoplasmic protein [Thermodesulfobacteriota bacterium]